MADGAGEVDACSWKDLALFFLIFLTRTQVSKGEIGYFLMLDRDGGGSWGMQTRFATHWQSFRRW